MSEILIVNPQSNGGRTQRLWTQLKETIHAFLPNALTRWTRYAGHGIELAEEAAASGASLVIAVGGDGTLNEVVNGLMRYRDRHPQAPLPDLGLLPQGTGGDFRRSLGLPHQPAAYLSRLAATHTRKLDIGRIRYQDQENKTKERFFLNVASLGLGGLVDQQIAHTRHLKGSQAYFLASLRAMKDNVLAPLTLRLQGISKTSSERSPDEAREERTLHIQSRNLAICNARFFGGGMMIAPHARPDDGLFDLINFSHPSRLHLLPLSQSLYQGKHLHQPHIQSFRASSLSIELDDPSLRHRVLLDVDGEALGHPPLYIEMLPAALSLRF